MRSADEDVGSVASSEEDDTLFSGVNGKVSVHVPLLSGSRKGCSEQQGVPPDQERARRRILLTSFAVLFIRYGIATFLSAFFPDTCTELGISGGFEGLIFAGYPIGIAVMGVFGPLLILKLGTRSSVAMGLFATSVFTVAFGLVPDIARWTSSDTSLQKWLFLVLYTLSGLLGALSDTAVIMLCGDKFKDKSGVIFAALGTVSGIGCMAGPPAGGALHSLTGDHDWNFRVPFLVWGGLPLVLIPVVFYTIPQEHLPCDSSKAPITDVLTPSVLTSLTAIALSGTVVGTLDPTLYYRLHPPLNDAEVGLYFMYSSISYTIMGLPIGWATERLKTREKVGDSRMYKFMQAAGLLVLALTFALLGPVNIPGKGGERIHNSLHTMGVASVAMVLKGVGSAANNAGYPDLVLDLPEGDRSMQARIDGLWNAAYAIGWAAGPLIGGGLYSAWGFAGMATAIVVMSLVYAFFLTVMGLLRWGSGGWRGRPDEVQCSREAAVVAAMVAMVVEGSRKVDELEAAGIDVSPMEPANSHATSTSSSSVSHTFASSISSAARARYFMLNSSP